MAIAVFDPAKFKIRYPVFATVNDATLQEFFLDAGLYLSNTDTSPVQDVTRRLRLLNMLTAHIGYLEGVLSSDGQPRPVGRMSQAAEGSVSATFSYSPPTPGSAEWFNQSSWGAAFWQATASLRTMRYRPRPTNMYGNNRPNAYVGYPGRILDRVDET